MAKSLPSFTEVVKQSWELFRTKFKQLFLLNLVFAIFASLVAIVIGGVTAGTIAWKLIGSAASGQITSSEALPLVIEMLPKLGLMLLLLVVAMSFVSAIFEASRIYLLKGNKKFGELLAFGKTKMLRVFAATLLVGLITIGGFWLLGIPGLLFCYLTSFTIYEVVLSQDRLGTCMKRSIGIIWDNFWPLLGRFVLMVVIVGVARSIFSKASGDARQGMELLAWLVDTLTSWFLVVYSYVLYTHAKEATSKSVKVSLAWVVVPAVIGWIVFGTIVVGGAKFLQSRGVFDDFWGKVDQMIQDEDKNIKMPDTLGNLDQTS